MLANIHRHVYGFPEMLGSIAMHFLLALNKPAIIQSIYSIASGQYQISNTGKKITNYLPSTRLLLLFGETKNLEILKIKIVNMKTNNDCR